MTLPPMASKAGATVSLAFPLLTAVGERGWDGGSGDAGVRAPVADITVAVAVGRRVIETPLSIFH
jgi:hypothetical protein